ncbi:replication initiation protein [Paenibacillus sp. GCM10012307]|uniref:Replication initiation protein n=1 Tax=Paenibacillus roseus TaxID=2798579 RepID=A0A934MP91_9BACL|nr:replication initiation protein [Paenibacillus roseus]MBJ6361826.1 replication initiation protein [Paenibacillus roseus]
MSLSMQLQAPQPLIPLTRAEAFFGLLYGTHMQAFPKRTAAKGKARSFHKERQWVFVGSKDQMKSMATQSTLYAVLADQDVDTTYYTPNGYYRRDLRLTETLRWLNGYVFDLDVSGESVQDIMDRIKQAGLPSPTAVIRTPRGGFHVAYFFNQPVRATTRAVKLYTAIMRHMASDLGADLHAVGANRIFRTPTDQNLVQFEPSSRYDFDWFKDWRDINHPYDPSDIGYLNINTQNLMEHPALEHLLTAPCPEGSREATAFNLALAMKASDWPQARAESALQVWFNSCCSKFSKAGKDPFTERDAVYKAGYVYLKSSLHAPTAEIIRELSGLPFAYAIRNEWETAKSRSDRERVHLHEWSADLLELLSQVKELAGTQQELATRLNCPLASFKLILKQLSQEQKIITETRKGRGGSTIIRLPEPPEVPNPQPESNIIPFPPGRKKPRKKPYTAPTVIIQVDFGAPLDAHSFLSKQTELDPDPPPD